jgi:hypothetical protein
MLPGEQCLPEEIYSHHGNSVDHVVQFARTESNAYLADRVRRLIRALPLRWYRRSRRHIVCPSCGVNEHTRKGWRPRVLRSSRGRLVLLVLQANASKKNRDPFERAPVRDKQGYGIAGNELFSYGFGKRSTIPPSRVISSIWPEALLVRDTRWMWIAFFMPEPSLIAGAYWDRNTPE